MDSRIGPTFVYRKKRRIYFKITANSLSTILTLKLDINVRNKNVPSCQREIIIKNPIAYSIKFSIITTTVTYVPSFSTHTLTNFNLIQLTLYIVYSQLYKCVWNALRNVYAPETLDIVRNAV